MSSKFNFSDPNNPRHNMGSPGLPMVYRPETLDTFYSEELAARLAREYTKECIDSLVDYMRDRSNPQTSLVATNALLDRGWGKPREIKSLSAEAAGKKNYRVQIEFVDVIDSPLSSSGQKAPEPEFKE